MKIERLFTWSEVKAAEDVLLAKLQKEKHEKELAHQLVRELTHQMNLKNKENEKLTFFVEALSIALKASCEAIETLKRADHEKQTG